MRLSGRVAIITGAGRGIGRAIARRLAAEGASLVLAARSQNQLNEAVAELQAIGCQCLAVAMDVSSAEAASGLARSALDRFGQIDILVNNAGVQGPIGPMLENNPDEWLRTVRVNLLGPFLCTRAVVPYMIQRQRGKIINLSGGGATSPRPNFSAYGVSKVALVRLTETLAVELAGYNIQVNAVAPGAVNTHMLDEILAAGVLAGEELAAARRRQSQGGTPPELAAELVTFLVSDEAGLLTGKLISALYDGWRQWTPEQIEQLNRSNWLTLRRVDAVLLRQMSEPRFQEGEAETWAR